MFRNYLKIALRSFYKNKQYSIVNIAGLSVGIAISLIIGLWIWDELSFNTSASNYREIAQVMQNESLDKGIETLPVEPLPLAKELRSKYASDFKYVAATTSFDQVIAVENKRLSRLGSFAEPDFPEMMTLKMVSGSRAALNDPSSILVSRSLATSMFGSKDPLGQIVRLGTTYTVQVKGVYEDLPANNTYADIAFIAPLHLLMPDSVAQDDWYSSSFQILVQLNPGTKTAAVSEKIKNLIYDHTKNTAKPALYLYPMNHWHLYDQFKNGKEAGGNIQYVWMFGAIAVFILLLASINFMNLSTARSEKRAREVGIRKAIGSSKQQLIGQFFLESFLMVTGSFILALLLVEYILPFFNVLAGKKMTILWTSPLFWLASVLFIGLTGLLTGSYPALYLSSFQPVKVLKGAFRVGRNAAIPRKVMVVVQFMVSVILAVGTLVVYRQIQFAKDRPLGYDQNGLVTIPLDMNTPLLRDNVAAFRRDLLQSGAIVNMAVSSSPTTGVWSSANNLDWRGKDPNRQAQFGTISASADFGRTIGWQIIKGRGFSPQFGTDSMGFVLNEAAVKLTGLQNPIGEQIKWHGKNWTILGVVKDMVMTSPFQATQAVVFMMNRERALNVIDLKLNPRLSPLQALTRIETIFKNYNPDALFEYQFSDEEYAKKFAGQQRIGRLAGVFALLALFISCIGVFGMASYAAEQRTKEIGVRKVLGASVLHVWGLLSMDFVGLVMLSLLIAMPVAWYEMNNWLQQYEYRAGIPWWIFVATGAGALGITLLTVSYQTIRAALINPVKSLRAE
jgi:putative ABC transport system permease protein